MTTSKSWAQLNKLAKSVDTISIAKQLQNPSRLDETTFNVGKIYIDLSKHLVTPEITKLLELLGEEADIAGRARRMFAGEKINTSEDRPALHTSLRIPEPGTWLQRIQELSTSIRNDAITDVINIGIGGSDLGPKMVVRALREFHDGPRIHFISNVDGAEINSLLPTLNAESTLIVISSKSFTTGETLLNAQTTLAWLAAQLDIEKPQASRHCYAITASANTAIDFGVPEAQILTFDESIGGRYSVWSSIGFVVAIALGFEAFTQFHRGAAIADKHFLETALNRNVPALMALLGVWYNNFLGAQSHAVIPYCERLDLFVNHLQQVEMESSGKNVTQDGEPVATDTSPVIWGQTGTNGQHAFFQMLHQGTQLVPVDFIGVVRDGLSSSEHHRALMANMIAQAEALMTGQHGEHPYTQYPGNRPSTTLLLDSLDPESLGTLLALYEHKVFAQGCIWGINSFDQWGVELGKQLANRILEGSGNHDVSTLALLRKTGLSD